MTVPPVPDNALDETGHDHDHDQDSAMLREMRSVAAGVQPDAAFRDRLWADLAARPAAGQPAPTMIPPRWRHEEIPLRRSPRPVATGRRWTSPVATIAAALVIALVGYGALSLSGATPTGINLNLSEMPNASAQGQTNGQALSDHPVVGTWAMLDDALEDTSSSLPLLLTMTLDPGGGVTVTSIGDWTGHGSWTASGDTISVEFSVLVSYVALERQMQDDQQTTAFEGQEFVPHIVAWALIFTLSEDHNVWEDVEQTFAFGVRTDSVVVGTTNPAFFIVDDYVTYDAANDPEPVIRRLDQLVRDAPRITAEDAGLASSDASASPAPGMPTTEPSSTEAGPDDVPTALATGGAPTPTQPPTPAATVTPTLTPLPIGGDGSGS